MASRLRLAGESPSDPHLCANQSADGGDGAGEGEGGAAKKPEARREVTDLGGGSEVVHVPRFVPREAAWGWFDYLDTRIPWKRPTIRVFGRSAVQPRDTCYVADQGLTDLKYSGHQPHAHSWDEFPVLKDILKAVHEALPESNFNSLLLNRYKTGSDYVSWHADDEPLYGPTPEIASVTFGCEREFLLRKKPSKSQASLGSGESARKRLKVSAPQQQHSFLLKHGSLLVMRGYTQRDWHHSVPKRAKASSPRINLTFRRVL
ncbi:DNA oxidative demethylase ALKBH2 [Oryza brachyantha]|uniref:DNA oxidative demethylase ALKBH2 n=1 Tax=Oryza brachyantha TaxID=4533 RepID=UPI001ADA1AE4|nr:DNA oxidative demethylase ALKBH2 [Oryza brachyantha]